MPPYSCAPEPLTPPASPLSHSPPSLFATAAWAACKAAAEEMAPTLSSALALVEGFVRDGGEVGQRSPLLLHDGTVPLATAALTAGGAAAAGGGAAAVPASVAAEGGVSSCDNSSGNVSSSSSNSSSSSSSSSKGVRQVGRALLLGVLLRWMQLVRALKAEVGQPRFEK